MRDSFAVEFYLNDGLVSRKCADWIWADVCGVLSLLCCILRFVGALW